MANKLILKKRASGGIIETGYQALGFDDNGIIYGQEGITASSVQAVLPYTTYVALVSQSGTSNPTSNIINNTLSGTPTLDRTGTGSYTLTLAGEFTSGTTNCNIGSVNTSFETSDAANIYRVSDDIVEISTGVIYGSPADDILSNTSIQIIIY